MVLLQQAISGALAFESVVWDVARIAGIQIIHYHFVRASMAKTSCYIALQCKLADSPNFESQLPDI